MKRYGFVICILLGAAGLFVAAYLPNQRAVRTLHVPLHEILSQLDRSDTNLLLESFPAGYLESCSLVLSTRFPTELRTGSRSGISQETQIRCPENLPPDVNLAVEGRIDESAQWILPDGLIHLPVTLDKPAKMSWVVIPEQAGKWNGSLWTYLVISMGVSQRVTLAISSITPAGRAISFLGMDHSQLKFGGLILGGIGFVLFVLVKFIRLRKSS